MSLQLHRLGFLMLLGLLLTGGCTTARWKLMRTVNPYLKKQPANPYEYSIRVGGARLQIKKFYATPTLACAALHVDNSKGYANVYIIPHKTKLVCGKTGIWALKSTAAAREPMFRHMAQDYFKLTNPKQISHWSKHYLARNIPMRQTKQGLICFQLKRSNDDPEGLKLKGRCRLRLTDMRVASGKVRADWMHIEPLHEKHTPSLHHSRNR